MSGAGSIGDAVEAIKIGARDYFQKPFELTVLGTLLDQVKRDLAQRKNVLAIESQLVPELGFCGMLGRSAVMQELFGLIRRLAPHIRTALVTGESGSGKDLVAHALHRLGPRSSHELVTVNCQGLTESQAENALFGHVAQGPSRRATDDRAGAFEKANGGVLFLDEIGELPIGAQGRLLRALDEINHVGPVEVGQTDVIVIAATKRDLRTEMITGRCRPELFHRFSAATIHVPPLAGRKEDIPFLAGAFIGELGRRLHKPIVGLTVAGEVFLQKREWTGNVRELHNVIERACMLSDGELLTERQLLEALK